MSHVQVKANGKLICDPILLKKLNCQKKRKVFCTIIPLDSVKWRKWGVGVWERVGGMFSSLLETRLRTRRHVQPR